MSIIEKEPEQTCILLKWNRNSTGFLSLHSQSLRWISVSPYIFIIFLKFQLKRYTKRNKMRQKRWIRFRSFIFLRTTLYIDGQSWISPRYDSLLYWMFVLRLIASKKASYTSSNQRIERITLTRITKNGLKISHCCILLIQKYEVNHVF